MRNRRTSKKEYAATIATNGRAEQLPPTKLAEKVVVTIAMPALNEESYIANAIDSIAPKDESIDYELLVLDGGSIDETEAIVHRLSLVNSRIRIVKNGKKIQSSAINIAARIADARSKYLIRADCHAVYPPRFVETCIKALQDTGAASVVVSMHSEGRGLLQEAIAAAQNSRLGNGGAVHRLTGWSGYVDHGHHAGFDRKVFLELGGYDESFSCNEDAELDFRIAQSRRRIYLCGEATITYFPRKSLVRLASQYFNFGAGRAKTIMKHRITPKFRQLMPVVVLLSTLASFALSIVNLHFLFIPLGYLTLCMGWGALLALRRKSWHLVLSGVAAMIMHLSWAAGFLYRLVVRETRGSGGPAAPEDYARFLREWL